MEKYQGGFSMGLAQNSTHGASINVSFGEGEEKTIEEEEGMGDKVNMGRT